MSIYLSIEGMKLVLRVEKDSTVGRTLSTLEDNQGNFLDHCAVKIWMDGGCGQSLDCGVSVVGEDTDFFFYEGRSPLLIPPTLCDTQWYVVVPRAVAQRTHLANRLVPGRGFGVNLAWADGIDFVQPIAA